MRLRGLTFLLAPLALSDPAWATDLAPGATLRAVYLGTNPAQAARDPATGHLRGPSYELAAELARLHGMALAFRSVNDPPTVIEEVRAGRADIGFVAYEATRLGTVEFSQPYMLVQQSFLVLDGSPIRAIADIDQPDRTIAGTTNDSITLCMQRILHRASVLELPNDPAQLGAAIAGGTIDALGANRQRLTTLMRATPGTRLLADDLFSVPQNVVVPKGSPAALAAVDAVIDTMRQSGQLQAAITRGGAVGVTVAPKEVKAGCPGG